MSSNVAQSYPYTTETEAQRRAAVADAVTRFDGLADKISGESDELPMPEHEEPGQPQLWWVFVCPRDDASGRLHVAGYAKERHALYTVCDTCGNTYLR